MNLRLKNNNMLITCNVHVIILILSSLLSPGQGELRLELVQVLFRHGERTPVAKEMYPNDIHSVSAYEPFGLSQLTNQGKMSEYRIGKMLRERYNDFLGDLYHQEDVYAYSTHTDRAKASLQLVLAGLYPPATAQSWNPNLPWSPIPTHFAPERADILFNPQAAPMYVKALSETLEMPEVDEMIKSHEKLYKLLSEKTGLKITKPVQVYNFSNLFAAQRGLNLTLPDWCTEEVLKEMEDCVVLEYEIRSHTTTLKRLLGGRVIRRFVENMKKNEDKPGRKIYLYSGHKSNLASCMRAHDIHEPRIPTFGTAIMFEMLRDDMGNRFVTMNFWTGATGKIIPLKLGKYENACPMDVYLEMVENVIPTEEETRDFWDGIRTEDLSKIFDERLFYN